MLISLIVATCNRVDFLRGLLESLKLKEVLNREDIEVIVVDNGAVDTSTHQCCQNYNVIYLHQDFASQAEAINLGIRNSKGKYIAFVDDDVVIIDSEWLYKLYKNFIDNPRLGYVSGNVLPVELKTEAQIVWQKKGGLSKGQTSKTFTRDYLASFDPTWRLSQVAMGANCMIPKEVLDKTTYWSTFMGWGSPIPHGSCLEIVYQIIRRGYELRYDQNVTVLHNHPTASWNLRKKMYFYGMGDVCYQLYIFAEYKDWRYLYGATIRHLSFIIGSILMGIFGKYPMPVSYRIFSLLGSLIGFPMFVIKYPLWKLNHE